MHPKLAWVEGFKNTLGVALGSSLVASVQDHVDPLKKLVILDLGDELKKGDWNPIQKLAHAFAKANDCVIERIRRQPRRLIFEVLVKTRLGPVMNKNPLRG